MKQRSTQQTLPSRRPAIVGRPAEPTASPGILGRIVERMLSVTATTTEKLLFPVAIMLLTAKVGTNIATTLQDRSFERQHKYDRAVARLERGQDESIRLMAEVRSLRGRIRAREVHGGLIPFREPLNEAIGDVESIRALGVGVIPAAELDLLASAAVDQFKSYISCMDTTYTSRDIKSQDVPCSTKYDETAVQRLSDAFSAAILSYSI